ncbi:hypothetical protein SKAU_G00013120 [Synaphobranchus kaupii]|uniref:Uncharacterized protein n=1 Tax=Synaphobranchus kaupii TaxID=118154 RepID=A0A9Q1JDQ4_SYNKA|nr:hypothetical protein SKAU_G00013120 [Synaphobranchus kaupii]
MLKNLAVFPETWLQVRGLADAASSFHGGCGAGSGERELLAELLTQRAEWGRQALFPDAYVTAYRFTPLSHCAFMKNDP